MNTAVAEATLPPTAVSLALAAIGSPVEGGWLAGRVRVADSLFALILPPKAERHQPRAPWSESLDRVASAMSYCDGHANTLAMAAAGSAIAKAAIERGLYIPARDELELLYRAFKPGTTMVNQWRAGDNPSSEPPGYPYTDESPQQCALPEFRTGQPEAFEEGWYWSSTQFRDWADYAWLQDFDDGGQILNHKSHSYEVAFVRRTLIR